MHEEVDETFVREAEPAAVEPHKEGGLRSQRSYLRDILTAELLDIYDIAFDIFQHLPAPLLAVFEGGFGCNRSKQVRSA